MKIKDVPNELLLKLLVHAAGGKIPNVRDNNWNEYVKIWNEFHSRFPERCPQ